MLSRSTLERFWVRGLWVFLMMVLINVSLGLGVSGLAILLRSLFGLPVPISYLLFVLSIGFPLLGWIFEQFAKRLPRLES
jgi:Mn2+/Fe2+ NRAMP family transporter